MKENPQKLVIRTVEKADIRKLVKAFCFPWSTLERTQKKWEGYFSEHEKHLRVVCIALLEGVMIGYGSLVFRSEYPIFQKAGIPEIHDVWMDEAHRLKGYGEQIIKYLESAAKQRKFPLIGIGVGLYKDYGIAQRLYVKMGYVPDGNGLTYKFKPVIPANLYTIDDDLLLWFTKKL